MSSNNNEKGNNNGSIGINLSVEEHVIYIRTFINFMYPNIQLYIVCILCNCILYIKTLLIDIKKS